MYADKAQYTDLPEKSAKACLDSIKQIGPGGQYRGAEVKALANRIVSHYLVLADKGFAEKDPDAVRKWLERAKLMNADTETIREKERAFGLLKSEK